MKGDQDLCLAGGMDGYLAKPIRAQELDLILAPRFSSPARALIVQVPRRFASITSSRAVSA
jgi:hypothetical protein